MNSKKIAVCMLSATLLMQSATTTVYAKQIETKKLSLENAIKHAKDTSITLKKHYRTTELAKESAEMAKLTGGYYAYDPANVQYQYMQKQEEVIKDNIELTVTQVFDGILYIEAQIENLNQTILLQEKQIEKSKVQYEKGMESQLGLEETKLKHIQWNQQKEKLEKEREELYRQLCQLIGSSTQSFELEKSEIIFEPYAKVKDLESFAESKAKKHLEMWKASEDLRVAMDTPIFTQDYMQYISKKADREDKKDNFKMTEDQLKKHIQDTYVQLKKVELDYLLKQKDFEIKEKQHQINKVYLEKGMMSQLDYELSELQYETAKLDMQQLINDHYYLKFKLDHPHLIQLGIM